MGIVGRKKGQMGRTYLQWIEELERLTVYEQTEEYNRCILYRVLRRNREIGWMVQLKNGSNLMGVGRWFNTTRKEADSVVERLEGVDN